MVKYLLLFMVIVWLLYSPALRRKRQAPDKPATRGTHMPPQVPATAPMVRCAHCDLHLPSDEALQDGQGRTYCSETHRQAGPALA